MKYTNRISNNQWVAFVLVTLQWFLLTSTEPFVFRGLRWYHTLFVSLGAYLFMRRKFVWRAIGKYRSIFILLYFSWISLFFISYETTSKVEDFIRVNLVVVTYLILIPTMAHQIARKTLFFGIIYSSLMGSLVVMNYTTSGEIFFDTLSGFGSDKNFIGMLMGMSIIMISVLIISPKVSFSLKFLSIGCSFWLLYWIYNTGSRSAGISTIMSLLITGFIYFFKMKGFTVKFWVLSFSAIIIFFSINTIDSLIKQYGRLDKNMNRLVEFIKGERKDINARMDYFSVGINKISNNPIIGSGHRSSNFLLGEYRNVHNTYIALWYEYGLTGFFSMILLVIFIWKEIIYQVENVINQQYNIYDFGLSLTGIPLILMMGTLNLNTIMYFYLCLFSAFNYDRFNQPYLR